MRVRATAVETPTAISRQPPSRASRISRAVTSSSRSFSRRATCAVPRADSALRIRSTRAESAASTFSGSDRRSASDSSGRSVRRVRYFSAVLTSGPVTVEASRSRAAGPAAWSNSAREASSRTRACWAAALSSSRVRASSLSLSSWPWTGRPVYGSVAGADGFVPGTASAARSRPRVADACSTAPPSASGARVASAARGGGFSASSPARPWSLAMTSEYAWKASVADPLPVRASRRREGMVERSRRSEADASGPISSIFRSTRAAASAGSLPPSSSRPAAMYPTTSSRSSARECARVIACWFSSASVTSRWDSLRSAEAPRAIGAPAAITVIPTTATPATSLLRTRTVRLPAPTAGGVAPDPSRVLSLLRGRFFCTGARNLDSSTHEAEMTHGHVLVGRPTPGTASDHSSAFERGARINRSATRTSEHHYGVGEQVSPEPPPVMHGPPGGTSAQALAGCPPAPHGRPYFRPVRRR